MPQDRERAGRVNHILAALPAECRERLVAAMELGALRRGDVIHAAGMPIEHVYFVDEGLVSLVKAMADGRVVEVGTVGIEGMIGLAAIVGTGRAIVEAIVQVPGSARRIAPGVLREEMSRSAALQGLLLRYVDAAAAQFVQTAACNSIHSVEQRCCRWLLAAHDSAGSDSFTLTHELVALMLGVQRASVSIAASTLQKAGIIEYRHGRVTITNRGALEARACECHAAIRAHFDNLIRS